MRYVMIQAPDEAIASPKFYGGARDFWAYRGPEAMLDGPYETGKTLAALTKLHLLLCKYPRSRALMVRKSYKSLLESALVTYERKAMPPEGLAALRKYGGQRPEHYTYPNGSRLVCRGLDHADDVLSAEYDFIYVNQAEELSLDDWEKLTGRATGRAGNAPYAQVFGDCNPGPPTHWILHRPRLRRFRQLHAHNPALYDPATGAITAQGRRSLEVLDALTGLRYQRGRLGLWVAAEGQVYDGFHPDVHVLDRFEIPAAWPRYRAIDFGFTNPFSCQWWASDPDGRLYLYREMYMTGRTVRAHAGDIQRWSEGERIRFTVADHDAEDRATLHEHGIPTLAAIKDIARGLQAVQERLKLAGDGRPRLFLLRDALVEADPTLYRERPGDLHPCSTEQEFSSYVWSPGEDGRPKREVPVEADNHGLDALRYLVMALERPQARTRRNVIYG